MNPGPRRAAGGGRVGLLRAAVGAAATALVLLGTAAPAAAEPAPRTPLDLDGDGTLRVAVVGDSILEGASGQIRDAFAGRGFEAIVDTEVSRSTLAGADPVRLYSALGVDAVVVMLGANDAADPEVFGRRVQQVLDATGGVPLVFWLTIPEVRDYYPAANATLRAVLATRPGASVLEWHQLAPGGGLTAGDGLHLTPGGGDAMAGFVVSSVLGAMNATASIRGARDVAPRAAAARTHSGDEGAEPGQTATTGGEGGSDEERVSRGVRTNAGDSIDSLVGRVGSALVLVTAGLAAAGLGLALWALWASRPVREHSAE